MKNKLFLQLQNYRDKVHLTELTKRLSQDYRPPVIIIGMHRSGTTMITRALRKHGMYFGDCLDRNSEPQVFQNLNDSILSDAGQSWKEFDSEKLFRDDKQVEVALHKIARMRHQLWSQFFNELGASSGTEYIDRKTMNPKPLLNYFLTNWPTVNAKGIAWGWKDPRNTLTLRVWLKLFPDAKVIHVIRNGIDVANSLWVRCKKMGWGLPECDSWEYCFRLWEKYVSEASSFGKVLETNYSEMRYEDFIQKPQMHLNSLFEFIGSDMCADTTLLDDIDSSRVEIGVDVAGKELSLKAASESPIFKTLGYSKILESR